MHWMILSRISTNFQFLVLLRQGNSSSLTWTWPSFFSNLWSHQKIVIQANHTTVRAQEYHLCLPDGGLKNYIVHSEKGGGGRSFADRCSIKPSSDHHVKRENHTLVECPATWLSYSSRIVVTMRSLPYQAGTSLSNIAEATTTESRTTNNTSSYDHIWELFHIPDINEDEEEEGDISSDKASIGEKTEAQKVSREKRIGSVRNATSMPNITVKHVSSTHRNNGATRRAEMPIAIAMKLWSTVCIVI